VDGVTGTLVPPRDADSLAEAIRQYLRDPDMAQRHGRAGRERALRDFRQEDIWEGLYAEYARLLEANRRTRPKRRAGATSEEDPIWVR
jgi:glycosyltransferase involved in cell wall biosynthesis